MEKLVVGPINQGLRTNRLPFNIDNDNFPILQNAFQWRGRVKRKRGTNLIGRLQQIKIGSLGSTDGSGNLSVNLISLFSLGSNGQIAPGSIIVSIGATTYTDNGQGILVSSGSGAGTIDYITSILTITGGTTTTAATIVFGFYPILPVMGLEDFATTTNDFPGTIAFDTKNSYNISTSSPYLITDTNYYKNPNSTGSYVQKGGITKANTYFQWNGQDYQQFWTTNYQGALWATNGIDTPFTGSTIGMQFAIISAITGSGTTVTITISISGVLVIGDFVYINEVSGMTGINWQTGYVTGVTGGNQIEVVFPSATIAGVYTSAPTPGIMQFLTNNSNPSKDVIRYYDGSPTSGSTTAGPLPFTSLGWVNFMPPLSQSPNTIADLPAEIYYLVGCRMIFPFKDRLLFIGPVVQSSTGLPIYLQDTVVYSQNGTPYYTSSYTNSPTTNIDLPTSSSIIFVASYTVPVNQTATAPAYFDDSTGFGGNAVSGLDQPIITVAPNEDVLMMGFNPTYQSRFVYTGNDIFPFAFYTVNSELGSSSTFSIITMDKGVITKGPRGYISSSQVNVDRIDLDIPDQVFEVNLVVNGNERFCAQRDFLNEWIYFTYPGNTISWKYPNTTLFYNYRDNSWAIFYENYTTYGTFRPKTGLTWNTLPKDLTWNTWNTPWNAGASTLLQPQVIAGNQQGFVLQREDDDTAEAPSLFIKSFSANTVTCPNHCLNNNDYIMISGASGTIDDQVNGKVFSVFMVTQNTFMLNPSINFTSQTYFGNGLITRYYVPFIQTKQFPMAWGVGRKTRIGAQQYLLTKTDISQITLQMFLSQDSTNAWNTGPITPAGQVENASLVYSQVLYTCPESTNLGLTPANTNLQQLNKISSNGTSSNAQQQIWHRINTSLIGDTIQLGFTLSDAQMRDPNLINQTAEIELHGFVIDVEASQMLS